LIAKALQGNHLAPLESLNVESGARHSERLQFQRDQFSQSEELLWRRGGRSTIKVENELHSESHESPSESGRRSTPRYEAALNVTPVVEPVTALRTAKLDPSLLDRLTDDVIQRVEKRMRIERNRRGL
jgi:hypothetical protein